MTTFQIDITVLFIVEKLRIPMFIIFFNINLFHSLNLFLLVFEFLFSVLYPVY